MSLRNWRKAVGFACASLDGPRDTEGLCGSRGAQAPRLLSLGILGETCQHPTGPPGRRPPHLRNERSETEDPAKVPRLRELS